MNKRIVNLLVFIAALTAAAIFTIAQAGKPAFVLPPAKQTIVAKETKEEATRAVIAAHITKIPDTRPIVEPASCPMAIPEATGLVPLGNALVPFGDGRDLNSQAVTLSRSGDVIYSIWAGAPDDNPTQGMIRVMADLTDPCAARPLGTQDPLGLTDYFTPNGPLTILRLEGDTIIYSNVSGGSGRFNFVTGKFLPLPAGKRSVDRSCPWPTPWASGISSFRAEGPSFHGKNLVNVAVTTASTGDVYWVWAGAPEGQPGQGLIRVKVRLADPCASGALGTQFPPITDYLAPKGPVTITQVEGDTILYSIAGGGSGRFNFVTGQFLP